MPPEPKEKCTCKYKCSRLSSGFAYVSPRNRREHAKHDREGKLCPAKFIVDRGSFEGNRGSFEGESSQINHGTGVDMLITGIACHRSGHRCTNVECAICFPGVQLTRQQQWRDRQPTLLYRSLTGGQQYEGSSRNESPEYTDADANGIPRLMQYGIHILPQLKLSLDEAIYRETWRLQSMLDEAKVPQKLQDNILKILYKSTKKPMAGAALAASNTSGTLQDMSGLELGELLRHAGALWDGGHHGIDALSSFRGLCSTFKDYGMPMTQRWRMCVGSENCDHSPVPLPPSHQDDYNLRTGLKCHCSRLGSNKRLARDCELCSERCPIPGCSKARKEMLPFEYFPIGPMLKKLCTSRSICHELQAMWRDKERWFKKDSTPRAVYKEWWDGYKASELSYFWDAASQFELPVLCRECFACYATIPQKCPELLEEANWDGHQYDFQCSDCGARVQATPNFTKGDPRNIALMAHWDGFQSATTAHKSTWTVEVQVLNARSSAPIPPIPVLFIPHIDDNAAQKKALNCLDAFLEPFIRELEELFVDGIEVDYNYPVELIDNAVVTLEKKFVLRANLQIFTGDHPAQCKFGGWNTTGYSACRNCKMSTRWIKHKTHGDGRDTDHSQQAAFLGRAVYDNNRRQVRYPPPGRKIEEAKEGAKRWTRASSKQEKTMISREFGISSMTRAWRLHDLTGFCLMKDLVYDTMHILALCLFKKYSELLVRSIPRSEQKKFESALQEVTTKRPKGFDGRWPQKPFERLGYFKAEEYTRFIIYCVPHILHEMGIKLDSKLGMLGILLVEIGRLFYIKSRDEGWSTETIDKGRSLLSSWRVRSEEAWGPSGAILEHVAGSGKIFDGIERHGPHHIYWCYRFERMVSDYGRTRTNQKDQEITYSQHFARRFFTKISSYIWQDDDGLFPHQRVLATVHMSLRTTLEHKKEHRSRDHRVFECSPWHKHCVVIVSSQKVALQLWDGMSSSFESYGCQYTVMCKGIGIGSSRKKVKKLHNSTSSSLKKCWTDFGVLDDLTSLWSDNCTPLRAAVWKNQVYRPGDHVVVLVDESIDITHPENWKAVIRSIFMHEFSGHMEIFFEADWYKQKSGQSTLTWECDEYSQFTILEPKLFQYPGNNCRQLSKIVHKFFPLNRGSMGDGGPREVVAMEIGDTLVRELPAFITNCPPFPEVGDVMTVIEETTFDRKETKLCVIREVILLCEGETAAENEAINSVAQDDEQDEGDIGDEIFDEEPNEQSSAKNIGRVKVSWLCKSGARSESPIYKASPRMEKELGFEALLLLRPQFQPIQFAHGIPIQWRIV